MERAFPSFRLPAPSFQVHCLTTLDVRRSDDNSITLCFSFYNNLDYSLSVFMIIMGNDSSVLAAYDIQEPSYAQVGQWSFHSAIKKSDPANEVTVMMAKLKSYGHVNNEIHQAVESLKKLRHPSILRYLNSSVTGECVHIFVEYAHPLKTGIDSQSELEICCGLQNILVALDFIHSKASTVHNNISKDAVFITKDGQWKLGLFDLSCRFSELTSEFLDQIHSFRYDKGVPPEDEGRVKIIPAHVPSRDIYGFGQLVRETISKCVDSGISDASNFLELATKQMQNVSPGARGAASSLTKHPFFNQSLLSVQDFLSHFAIKSAAAKHEFFVNLPTLLSSIPENVIGCKLVDALLSRLVVLNPTAQQHLLPLLLTPRTDSAPGLFDAINYRRYVVPVISRIFPVRDAQIRLLLLQYLPCFVSMMDAEHLEIQLLPELLLGIKDTDESIVAATLRALAELVPILGAATVIGGKRQRLFANGTPKSEAAQASRPQKIVDSPLGCRKIMATVDSKDNDNGIANTGSNLAVGVGSLPERHDPDGGEDGADVERSSIPRLEESEEDHGWSDWEADQVEEPPSPVVAPAITPVATSALTREVSRQASSKRPTGVPNDLSALEIQVKSKVEEFDYFADMEPTITATTAVFVDRAEPAPAAAPTPPDRLSFNVQVETEEDRDGWNWDD